MAELRVLSYAFGMSILVELAEQADVSVEGVLRVLTREPVSDAVKERVLAVLDELTPEQTRAVQRFALAALHDVLPRPDERVRAELPAETGGDGRPLPAAPSAAVLVELKSVLGELAEAVRDLKDETGAERRERVDDLAVMIDLITTGWQRLDGRLGRLERQLGRLESGPAAALSLSPLRPEPARGAAVPEAEAGSEAEQAEQEEPAAEQPAGFVDRVRSSRVPLAAAMFVGAVLGGIAVLQLLAGDSGAERLASVRETAAPASAPGRSGPATTSAVRTAPTPVAPGRPPASTASSTTSSVLGTTVGQSPKPAPPPAPKTTAAGSTNRATGTTTTEPSAPAAPPPGFQPTRNWAWAPVADADYYDVEFFRSGKSFYRASPKQARITLPDSLVFLPGAYRWVVRPGFGAPAAKKLGAPVVDSPFQVGA